MILCHLFPVPPRAPKSLLVARQPPRHLCARGCLTFIDSFSLLPSTESVASPIIIDCKVARSSLEGPAINRVEGSCHHRYRNRRVCGHILSHGDRHQPMPLPQPPSKHRCVNHGLNRDAVNINDDPLSIYCSKRRSRLVSSSTKVKDTAD